MRVNRSKLYLRIALPVFFAVFVAAAGIVIFVINFSVSIRSLDRVGLDYLGQTSQIVLEKTKDQLSPAARLAELNRVALNPGVYSRSYFDIFNTLTIPQFSAYPQFALIYFGATSGDFWLNGVEPDRSVQTQVIDRRFDNEASRTALESARLLPRDTPQQETDFIDAIAPYLQTTVYRRDLNGSITSVQADPDYLYDPRWRPWYANAATADGPVWSGVYSFSSSGEFYASGKVGVTVSAPVTDGGRLVGVVGIDIVLEELSRFLESLTIGENGRAFLFTDRGLGVAYGNLKIGSTNRTPRVLDPIADLGDFAVRSAYAALLTQIDFQCRNDLVDLDRTYQLGFDFGGDRYLAAFAPLGDADLPPWNVGIIVPQSDFVGDFSRAYNITALVSVFALFIVLLIALYISRLITTPIKQLTAEAERIRNLQLDHGGEIASPFVELQNMTEAFERMKSGLRSFSKYIPSDVVSYLIESGQDAVLGGRTQDVTIFFSDIAGFTGISEKLSPDELVVHLGTYLSTFSAVITQTGGTVDKYIGDAVMAFWNAPLPVANHPAEACRAALECRNRLRHLREEWRAKGLPPLFSRIGLHTGTVVVGNMGSEARLNYTILGDPVNLASRLEGLCKQYGTAILVSEDVYDQAKHEFAFRRIDRVMASGKTVPVVIYELVGTRQYGEGGSIPQWIATYEAGIDAYFAQDWNRAQERMHEVLTMRKRDKAAALIIGRIQEFRNAPPGTDWDGVARFTTK